MYVNWNEMVGLEVNICIVEMPEGIGWPVLSVFVLYAVPPGKFRETTAIWSLPLPSKYFPIHLLYHPPQYFSALKASLSVLQQNWWCFKA
jgi:hypothetical protein